LPSQFPSEREFGLIVNAIPALVWSADPDGSVDFVNQRWQEYTGLPPEQSYGLGWRRAIHADDVHMLDIDTAPECEVRLRRSDGVFRWFLVQREPLKDKGGKVARWYRTALDIEYRKQVETLRAAEKKTLEMVADGASLRDVLDQLCDSIELQVAPSVTTVLVMDADGKKLWQGGGQRVPHEWISRIIPVPVAYEAGLCGTAAFLKQRVIVPDVATEPNWPAQFRDLAIRSAIRAAWSEPILTKDNEVLGTFALYSHEARVPNEQDLALIKGASHIAHIAIERQRSQEALRNALEKIQTSEAKLRRVIDTIPTLAWCNLPDGPNEFLSKRWHEYTGLSPEESHGWGWKVAFHPEDLPALLKKWQELLISGEPGEIEARVRRHDGIYRWFLIRVEPYRDDTGKIDRWYGTSTDIEDRKKAEEALRTSQRKLGFIINTMPTFAWSARPDGSVDFLNERWVEYTGISAEQALDWKWTVSIHPDDLNNLTDYWRSIMATGEPGEIEARLRRFDGVYRWFLIRARAMRDESGKIVKWYGTNTDIDDRKRAEAQVEQAYLRLAEAQQLSKTGSFITDLVADNHDWSEETFRIFEFDPSTKVTVQKIRDIVHPQDLTTFDAVIARGMAGTNVDFIFRIVLPRGAVKHIRGMARVITQVGGHPLFIGALQDVTESKVAEEALDRARSELAHVGRVTTLNALTASIAHEINQPLSGIITNTSTCLRMLDGDPPNLDGARETVRRSLRDGNRASDVIARLRALFSKKEFTLETVDLNEATLEVIALSAGDLQRNRVLLHSELDKDIPTVVGDRVQLQQVTLNLLRNASDAMAMVEDRPRQILIRTGREGNDHVRLSVRDAGIGVNPQDVERLFEAFYTTKSGGMGIGLSVSRSIIEKHHGRLWVEPNEGPGVTFSFSIPCGRKIGSGAAPEG